jgi:hypothetical protein
MFFKTYIVYGSIDDDSFSPVVLFVLVTAFFTTPFALCTIPVLRLPGAKPASRAFFKSFFNGSDLENLLLFDLVVVAFFSAPDVVSTVSAIVCDAVKSGLDFWFYFTRGRSL